MIVRIQDNHWLYLDQHTADLDERVFAHFSVKSPRAYYIDTASAWDGWYRRYNKIKQRMALPFLAELKLWCEREDIPLDIDDRRPKLEMPDPSLVTPDLLHGVKLENYQIECIKSTCFNEIGCLQAPTGAGKTELICGVVKIHNCNTVIITEQIVVLEQIVERLGLRDVVRGDKIDVFCHGHLPQGNQIMVGSIQSLNLPPKPKRDDCLPNNPTTKKKILQLITGEDLEGLRHILPNALAESLMENPKGLIKLEGKYLEIAKSKFGDDEYQRRLQWYKTRSENSEVIRDMISRADMVLVDEADLASSTQYNNLFKSVFHGRRRYGFCIDGSTLIMTKHGIRRIDQLPLGEITLLANNGLDDVFSTGQLIQTRVCDQYKLITTSNISLLASGDHRIAKNGGGYVRLQNIRPGQFIKIQNDAFIKEFKNLPSLFTIINRSLNFGSIFRKTFEFPRSNFNKDIVNTEIDYINSFSIKFISDSRKLGPKFKVVSIQKLHKEKLVGRRIIKQISKSTKIISSFKFGGEFEPPRRVSFTECVTNFSSNIGIVNGITTESLMESIKSSLDVVWCHKYNGDTISFYHGMLDSLDHCGSFHGVINTVSLQTSKSAFGIIVENLTSINLKFNFPYLFLVCRNGKPIFYAIFAEHCLFAGLQQDLASIGYMRKFANTSRTEMFPKSLDMIIWTIYRTLENRLAVIATNCDNVFPSNLVMIPFSFDNHIGSRNAPIYFCHEIGQVRKILKTKKRSMMYDIVDVKECSNFYANNILVHNSGTFNDPKQPVRNLLLKENLGNVIHSVPRSEVQACGRIIPIKAFFICVGEENKNDCRAYDIAMREDIIDNVKFHGIVAKLGQAFPDEGKLILIDTSPIGPLGEALEAIIPGSKFLWNESTESERHEYLDLFEKRECKCLIGGRIFKRGLDLSGGTENLVVIGGGQQWSSINQLVGRAVRINSKGYSRVFFFFHLSNKYLYKHSREALKAVLSMGYEVTVVYGKNQIDGEKFVKSRYKLPR